MATVTHIAAADITLVGRYRRQLCGWCGAVLLDEDLDSVAVPVGQSIPGAWRTGGMIRIDGPLTMELEGVNVPPDFCGAATFLDPQDFADV